MHFLGITFYQLVEKNIVLTAQRLSLSNFPNAFLCVLTLMVPEWLSLNVIRFYGLFLLMVFILIVVERDISNTTTINHEYYLLLPTPENNAIIRRQRTRTKIMKPPPLICRTKNSCSL